MVLPYRDKKVVFVAFFVRRFSGKGKVLYVWFDAPISYISSTKVGSREEGKIRTVLEETRTKLVHFIGKDNIVFHCIIFPSMLKAEGSYYMKMAC
jgi:methionyl-tRNA synthetase